MTKLGTSVKIAGVIVAAQIMGGCSKHLGIAGVTATPTGKVVGAGQSNMANMNLADFQAKANGVIATVNVAVNGSELYQWQKDCVPGQHYPNLPCFYPTLLQAVTGSRALLWFQGETEGLDFQGSDYQTWGQRFTTLVGNLRADGFSGPILVVRLNDLCPFPGWEYSWFSVRDQQSALHVPGVIVVNVDDIPRGRGTDLPPINPPENHYTNANYKALAERLAAVYNTLN